MNEIITAATDITLLMSTTLVLGMHIAVCVGQWMRTPPTTPEVDGINHAL